jgi:basic membrane protein A
VVHKVGLSDPAAVRLSMAPDVPASVIERVERAAADIRSGRVQVPEAYDGPEFATPAA